MILVSCRIPRLSKAPKVILYLKVITISWVKQLDDLSTVVVFVQLEKGLKLKNYFRFAPRHSSSFPDSKTNAELMSKICQELKETEQVRLELRHEFLSQQICVEILGPHVSPTPKSTKGSCANFTTSGEDIIG